MVGIRESSFAQQSDTRKAFCLLSQKNIMQLFHQSTQLHQIWLKGVLVLALFSATDAFSFRSQLAHNRALLTGERPLVAQESAFPASPRKVSKSSSSISLGTSEASVAHVTELSSSSASSKASNLNGLEGSPLKPWQQKLTRLGMIAFVAAMCLTLPLTLLPQRLAYRLGMMSENEKENLALNTGQLCARWCLKLIPFCRITGYPYHQPNPPASIWVCNHASMLDIFILLAADKKLRGPTRRRIKIVYWKDLEKNPITRLLFRQAGFIPVQMAANEAGEDNDYDKSSFKQLLKSSKKAFADGFDIGILPEGQLNPTPEKGLMPVFSGAFTLAKISRRPVQMMALNGVHDLWHPVHGMHCIGRHIKIRVYPTIWRFANGANFMNTFQNVIEQFAMHGTDLPEEEMAKYISHNVMGSTPPPAPKESDSSPKKEPSENQA